MKRLTYTLISDGSSDTTLIHIINWCLKNLYPRLPIDSQYADFRVLTTKLPTGDVAKRIKVASKLYPSTNLYIYHRDAEMFNRNILDERTSEILDVLDNEIRKKVVCIIPIKMMESWLLTNEIAIKKAANNPNSRMRLDMPDIRRLEKLSEPKDLLHKLLKDATENSKRRQRSFNVEQAVHHVAEHTECFSQLRHLSAFNKFEQELKKAVDMLLEQ